MSCTKKPPRNCVVERPIKRAVLDARLNVLCPCNCGRQHLSDRNELIASPLRSDDETSEQAHTGERWLKPPLRAWRRFPSRMMPMCRGIGLSSRLRHITGVFLETTLTDSGVEDARKRPRSACRSIWSLWSRCRCLCNCLDPLRLAFCRLKLQLLALHDGELVARGARWVARADQMMVGQGLRICRAFCRRAVT